MLLLLALPSWADPCSSEAILGRVPKVLAGDAHIDEAELIISLRYKRSRVDGIPWTALRQARMDASWHVVGERDAVLVLAHASGAASARLRDASTEGLSSAEAWRWSPVPIPGPWTYCERFPKPMDQPPTDLITDLVWQQGVAAGGTWVQITTDLEELDRCVLRVPVEGVPRVRLTIQQRGPRPPAPLNGVVPSGAVQDGDTWTWEQPGDQILLRIPNCT